MRTMAIVRAALCAAILFGLAACGGGGGGGGGGVGEGGTGAFASGKISGFGSIIVNGVHFDDRTARIEDDDGAVLSRDDLRLGQVAEIESGAIDATGVTPVATASAIRIGSALVGRVDSVDAGAAAMVVLGQPVRVQASTVFDDALAGGLAALDRGDVVEVHGFFDPAVAGFVATRVDRRRAAPSVFKVRGLISGVDAAARTFRIGSQVFAVGIGRSLPANGQLLRVEVETEPVARRWIVVGARQAAPALADDQEAEIEGLVTRFASAADFAVDGVAVRTDAGTEFEGGSASLALGVRVEVEGHARGGVIRADKVKIESEDEQENEEFEISGTVTSLDAVRRSFVVRGVTVDYDDATRFDDGTATDLAIGRTVEVKGRLDAGGTRLQAQRIQFK